MRYIKSLSAEKFETHMLPGAPKTVNGASYFFQDFVETKTMVDEIFYTAEETDETDATANNEDTLTDPSDTPAPKANAIKDKDLKIQILNGGNTEGMANKKKRELERKGFVVTNVDTYTGSQKKQTRILSKDTSLAQRLTGYFVDPVVEQDSDLSQAYDVIVILGLDEK